MELIERYCKACDSTKSIIKFTKDKHEKTGYTYKCTKCRSAYYIDYYKKHPEKAKIKNNKQKFNRKNFYESKKGVESSRRAHLKRKYNITLESYNELYIKQNGFCLICGKNEMNNKNKVLCVDHNHKTGQIRGLLCGLCNTALGNFLDNKELLINAIKYLENDES